MLKLVFSAITFGSAVVCLVSSKSNKIYMRLAENGGEEFADKSVRHLKLCGFILMFFSAFWMIYHLIEKGL